METTADSVDSGLLRFSTGSIIGTGGAIETPAQRIGIQHVLPITGPADLARITVPDAKGVRVPLSEIATVKEDHQPLAGDAVINDRPGLLLVVEKLPWGNTLAVTHDIDEAIKSLQPGLSGITFQTGIFRQANFIKTSISNLTQALLLGFALVVIILALFLFEWRVALISLLTIPLSLMAAMLVLYLRGATVNTMTLAGLVIALGAVVDDAIIDVENILRRLRQHRQAGGQRSTASIILEASLEVRNPIVYATLIIVAAAVPIFLLPGLTGSFFRPLALSYTLAILASMAVALTVTPALALIMLRKAPLHRRESPVVRVLQGGYVAVLSRIVQRPRRAYAAGLSLVVVALLVVPNLGQSLFPTFKEHDFLIHWLTAPGTSVAEEARMTERLSKDLRAVPGVRSFGSHIGQAFLGEEVAGVNFGENWISIDPKADYDQTLEEIEAVINRYPGVYRDALTYLNERIEEVLTGSKQPLVVRVYGQDLEVIRAKGEQIQHAMAAVRGVEDAHMDLEVDEPQITVEVDLAKAARYGLKPGDVRRAASTLVAGEEVGDLFRQGKAYDTVVWSTPETRSSVTAIGQLPLDTPSGRVIQLSDVARVRVEPVPNVIERENDSRRIDVAASVTGRDLGSVAADVKASLAAISLRARVPRRGDRRVQGAPGGADDPVAQRNTRRADDPAAAAGLLRRLAAGVADPVHPADVAGRRRAGRLPRWRHPVTGLAGRFLHGVRHLGPQRHPADQPLPAPGAGGGRAIRPAIGVAGRPGAAVADPDDLAGHRAGGGAAGGAGRPSRARDRVPAGSGDPGRADHLDRTQPVRGALALPALRATPPGAAGSGGAATATTAGADAGVGLAIPRR